MSFILTTWYVNGERRNRRSIRKISFILTTWYVNVKRLIIIDIESLSFILTTWYVNNFDKSVGSKKIYVLY